MLQEGLQIGENHIQKIYTDNLNFLHHRPCMQTHYMPLCILQPRSRKHWKMNGGFIVQWLRMNAAVPSHFEILINKMNNCVICVIQLELCSTITHCMSHCQSYALLVLFTVLISTGTSSSY